MADGLYLVAEDFARGQPETIDLCGCAQAHRPVVHIIEAVGGVCHLSLCGFVPRFHHFVGVHPVGEVERRVDIDVFQHREVGIDGNVVLHAVAPILDEVGFEQQILLGVDRIAQMSRIAHGDFLIPSLLACHFLAFEGIETAYGNVQVGQLQTDG